MRKDESIALLSLIAVLLALGLTLDYTVLTDENNDFLKSFVGVEMLGFLGVILSITIGFLGQIYFSLKKFEIRLHPNELKNLKSEIRGTASFLCMLYFSALLLAFAKSVFPPVSLAAAIINCVALMVVLLFFLIFFDVVMSLFDLEN